MPLLDVPAGGPGHNEDVVVGDGRQLVDQVRVVGPQEVAHPSVHARLYVLAGRLHVTLPPAHLLHGGGRLVPEEVDCNVEGETDLGFPLHQLALGSN